MPLPQPFRRSVPFPQVRVELTPTAESAYLQDVDAQADALFHAAPILPGDGHAVVRADGGLWLAAGHEVLWTIFGIAPGAWRAVGPASGVVPRVVIPPEGVAPLARVVLRGRR